MSASPIRRRALPAIILLAGLTGCAGSTTTGAYVPAAAAMSHQVLPRAAQSAQSAGHKILHAARPKDPKDLYVADFADNAVLILKNGSWRDAGAITAGIVWPQGLFLDKRGNLYVANDLAPNVTEYAPGAMSPSFTYGANMAQPTTVATDAHGNLFEADAGAAASGFVNEYFQGVNATIESCTPNFNYGGNGGVYGVAVDKNGDVFVDYRLPGGLTGTIAEYVGGLHGCIAKTLPISLNGPAGMALDASGNLLVAEAQGGVVDEIEPPYTAINRTIGAGFGAPVDVKLSKDNTQAFVTDGGNQSVTVVDYASGANVKVLGAADGLSNVNGAVDGPNAVY